MVAFFQRWKFRNRRHIWDSAICSPSRAVINWSHSTHDWRVVGGPSTRGDTYEQLRCHRNLKDPVSQWGGQSLRLSDGPHFEPSSRYSRWHVLLYSLPISQCTPLHSRARRLSALIQSGSGAGIIQSRQVEKENTVVWDESGHVCRAVSAGAGNELLRPGAGHPPPARLEKVI